MINDFDEVEITCDSWSMGLPSKYPLFSTEAISNIFQGKTFVEQIDYDQQLNLTTKIGTFLPPIDLEHDFNIPKHIIINMDLSDQYAVAAGLHVLEKFGLIAFSREDGKFLSLDPQVSEHVGIVSFSSFSPLHTIIDTQNNPDENKYGASFLFKATVRACSHLAQIIKSKGPTLHINSACASTICAMDIARDWLKLKKCNYVVVIGADCVTNSITLPILSSAFSSANITTNSANIEEATSCFGKNRSGMIMGAACVGLLLNRGSNNNFLTQTTNKVRIVDLNVFNCGFHVSILHLFLIRSKLKEFVNKCLQKLGTNLEQFSKMVLYIGHETCTSACANIEIKSLRYVFGPNFDNLIIYGSKGITGHTMSVGIEDAISFEILSRNLMPTISTKEIDPELGTLNLCNSALGPRKYILRFSAGFGSLTAFALYTSQQEPQKI